MNYSELSDFDINVLVAEALGWWVVKKFEENIGFTEGFHNTYPSTIWADTNKGYCTEQFNFTDDWADAGQLMEDNRIDLVEFNDELWGASIEFNKVDYYSQNKKPKTSNSRMLFKDE